MATRINKVDVAPLSAAAAERWQSVPVTILSDVTAGRVVPDPRIRPLRPFPPGRRVVGPAVTAWCERGDFGAMLHALDVAPAGSIVVADAGGCLQTAYAGEILCGYARAKGIAGLIVNGALRDIDTIAAWDDFCAYALGNTARGPLSKERGTVNGPIVFGGVSVQPGDIVVADNDGLAIVALAEATGVLEAGLQRVSAEAAWQAELGKGRSLVDVFSVPEAI